MESVKVFLLDKNNDVQYGLNWGQRDGREPNQAYLQLTPEVYRSDFFPVKKHYFLVDTDDGISFVMNRGQKGEDGSALETPEDNSLLGKYLRKRLGVPEGAKIEKSAIDSYGRNDIDFIKIGDNHYKMNFSLSTYQTTSIYSSFSISSFSTTPFAQKYIRSLLAKPFVILTGNSGTGKTRIATRFAKYLEKNTDGGLKNHLLLPVGADWTDNTKILGFYNPLKKEYQSTPVLDFILLAKENPAVPFFLILDEMNLSHVERYFSDFLSAMESGEPIPLYKKDEVSDSPIPEEIELPKNLFVTGTVNIDETTYMFSPKVLDRANVIEFKPEMGDVLANLLDESGDDEIAPAEPGVAEGFMQLANEVRSGKIPDEVKTLLSEMKPIFESVYAELEKYGFEFAFRTAKEIRLYALASYKTAESEKPAAAQIADVQLLQKILPKIHGNRKQIGTLLDDLEKLCESYQLENSLAKIRQMKDKLSKTQYVSFI